MKKWLTVIIVITSLMMPTVSTAASSTEKQTTYFNFAGTNSKGVYVKADYIQWFRGERANKEAYKDKACYWDRGKCYAMDDYYIRNVNPKIRTLPVAKNAVITMVTYQIEKTYDIKKQKISLSTFKKEMKKPRFRDIPFHIELKNGTIIKITEQYIP
ncbi:hypothetical protein JOC77_003071 [Peribacillus deserti]|uniref:DUF3889 domain-containing protein n=1 Tax=Peribacillus deserti TaxID=673318 RepID=A0ABS2QKJ1_9BACI|nr:hypothetical protein [Peribacillus deserti]MBM7693627.1 hypothetical protein [Peribacillus deserti]